MSRFRLLLLWLGALPSAMAVVRHVGPGQPYSKPCQAFAEAQDGDVIEIDAAGNYDGDVCPITKNRLTIRGVNGRARIDAAGRYAWGKGIWVVAGDGIVVENIEFSGARVPDRNGAGIRLDSGNLTIRNCVFHDNENGILGGFYGRVLIEHSEFYDNGYGDGYSHNIYLNAVDEFVLQYSASRRSRIGHLVKSRAKRNLILYNRLTQESGSGSYEIDLPNGGVAYVIGNTIQQGETTQNRGMLSYGMEGLHASVPSQLYVVNNTFVSTRSAGATFVQVASSVTAPAVIRNNIFSGSGTLTTQGSALLAGNVTSGEMGFANPSAYDYRISNLSAALNAGVAPGDGGGYPLRPAMQYLHPLCAVQRYDVGLIDAGAFEYGVEEVNPVCAAGAAPAGPVLSGLALPGASVTAGSSFTATVTLSAPAGAGGASVALASSAPSVIPVPASITVPQGQASVTLPLSAGQVSSTTTVQITASLNGSSRTGSVTVQPPPTLASLTLSSAMVPAGGSFTATVTLSAPAGAGGAAVALASSAPALIPVPASIMVPQGQTSVTLTLAAGQVAADTAVQITASLNGSSKTAPVTIQGPPPSLAAFAVSSSTVTAGASLTATVTISATAGSGGATVALASSPPSVIPVPASVTVPQGQTAVTLTLVAANVTADTTVQITASLNGSSRTAAVTVQPPPVLAGLALSSTTVTAGGAFTATVRLSAPAGAGGAAVALASSAPSVIPVPASVTVPQGQTAVTLTLSAGQVSTTTAVQFTASLNGSSASASVSVQPQSGSPRKGRIRKVTRWPVSVRTGSTFHVTVELEAPAPAGGAVVTLSSTSTALRLPPALTVPEGATTVQAEGSLDAEASDRLVHLTAASENSATTFLLVRSRR